jgi:hypothetical protein
MHRIRTIATVAALVAAAVLGGSAAAQAAPMYELSATKNGVVKAHAVYFSANNTLCINLLNAPNPGAWAEVILWEPNGVAFTVLGDLKDDGVRTCKSYDSAFDGRSMHMRVRFHPQQGADVENWTWIVM